LLFEETLANAHSDMTAMEDQLFRIEMMHVAALKLVAAGSPEAEVELASLTDVIAARTVETARLKRELTAAKAAAIAYEASERAARDELRQQQQANGLVDAAAGGLALSVGAFVSCAKFTAAAHAAATRRFASLSRAFWQPLLLFSPEPTPNPSPSGWEAKEPLPHWVLHDCNW
jgi:hypothetical protein